MNKNIMLSSVSGKVRLIKSMVKAASEEGISVFGYDSQKYAVGLQFCHEGVVLPKINETTFLEKLLEECNRLEVGYLIPTSEQDLIFFNKNRNFLEKNGLVLVASPDETIRICTSKILFNKFCLDHGFPVPKSFKSIEMVSFPCVVKKEHSQASRGVYIEKDINDLRKTISTIEGSYLLQEFNPGEEYSVDAFFGENGSLVAAIPRIRNLVVDGEAIVTTSKKIPEIVELISRVGKKLRFYGHVVMQVFMHNGSIEIIEINPRFGGASSLSFYCGVFSPNWIVNEIVGKSIENNNNLKYEVTMMKYSSDIFLEND